MADQTTRDTLPERLILMFMSRWLSKRRRRRSAPQLAVLSGDTVGDAIVLNGVYEKYELEALMAWLLDTRPQVFQKTVLEIGGNIGNHAVFFARYFRCVISFEPNPRIFPLLAYNLTSLQGTEARNLALSDSTGAAKLAVPEHNLGGAQVVAGDEGVDIHLERLDDQYLGEAPIGLMKLDVEGHELKVLEGGPDRIARDRPIMVFEQHGSEIAGGSSRVIDWLKRAGYQDFHCVERPGGLLGKLRPVAVRPVNWFEKRNHPMIVALHGQDD